MDTEKVTTLLSVPPSHSLSVDTRFPISEFGSMTLGAETIGFFERNGFTAGEAQHVAVLSVVTVQAPAIFFIMIEKDFFMEFLERPTLRIRTSRSDEALALTDAQALRILGEAPAAGR